MHEDAIERKLLRRQWLLNGYVFVALMTLLVIYMIVPVEKGKDVSVGSMAMFVFGVALFTVAVGTMGIRQQRGTSSSSTRVQIWGLLMLLVGSIAFFALSYYRLAQTPGQFVDLNTGIDAVYFAVTTTSTVGFGDVHASGQVARVEVIVQIIFSLVVLAGGARLLTTMLRTKAKERQLTEMI